jgi:hypothetical protein
MNTIIFLSMTAISIGLLCLANPLAAVTGAVAFAAFINE